MRYVIILMIAFQGMMLFSCKDTSSRDDLTTDSAIDNDFDAIEEEQAKELLKDLYVMAPSGLSLRSSNSLSSDKLATMGYGEKVKQLSVTYSVDTIIEQIPGSMVEVAYNSKKGYAFSGFLTHYPMPLKEEESVDYLARLTKVYPETYFTETETDPDFHDGFVERLRLPSAQWHEAFYIAKAKYRIPNSFQFPGHQGAAQQRIPEKDKDESVWSSDLYVSRLAGRMDTLQYNWRAEGSGFFIILTEPSKGEMHIEYTVFVD